MAVIRDVMAAFELYQPSSVADAQKLLEQHGPDAWVLAGGLDSFDWLKDRIRKPKAVVDLSGIEELRGVRTTADGVEIGAMTTLTEIVNHPIIKQKYGLLAQAAEVVASPQIRNQGTLGGNVSQDTRCWYSSCARERVSAWWMPRIISSVLTSTLRGCTSCSLETCLLLFVFRPHGRARNSILRKCETGTYGILRS